MTPAEVRILPVSRCAVVFAVAVMAAAAGRPAESRAPEPSGAGFRIADPRLRLTVFASDPTIVTPIGIAIDGRDRLFVLESHTHLRPADYPGPDGDRVKVFVDEDRDGVPDSVGVFAEGLEDGMNLAFSPGGELYVAGARGVWVLHDRDGDGVSDARTQVLTMVKPERVFDHAAIMGLAFSLDGWMYVSRGNTGGAAWRIEGTDGSWVSGYGDGGNIIRSRPDGRDVQQVATGFWNPFDLRFDRAGRLLATDNDPDSRGPNRLVHVIQGGDYGYKSLYGGSGIHPYLSWNGELPGTLPYAAPLGEAPSGMLIAAQAALPREYADDVLVTVWEERSIVSVPLSASGVSVAGEPLPLIEGDAHFRPVAFAADSHGTIYFTDWMLRSYPNHGRGRIWRLTADGPDLMKPRPMYALPEPDPGRRTIEALLSANDPAEFPRLRQALAAADPFLRSAAITALAQPVFREAVRGSLEHPDARVRVGSLLALQRGDDPDGEAAVTKLLSDPDPMVRRMALVWAGSAGMMALRPILERAILVEPATPELFEVYLATLQQLTPEFVESYRAEAEPFAGLLKRELPAQFLESFVADTARPEKLRALAVGYLRNLPAQVGLLARLTEGGSPPALRAEAVRSLGMVTHPRAGSALLRVIRDAAAPAALRADALAGLARQPVDGTKDALRLLDDPAPMIRLEAARYLRSITLSDSARAMVARRASELSGPEAAGLQAQLAFALGIPPPAPRPSDAEAWHAALAARTGRADAGRRVFFSAASACAQCHRVDRRGGDLGPDLTNVGHSKSARQILDGILRPSAEVSPEYQGWFVRTRDGEVLTGRQIDVAEKGVAELYGLSGEFITIRDIEEFGPMPESLMPAGLETNLTVDDMADLLAFLAGSGRQTP